MPPRASASRGDAARASTSRPADDRNVFVTVGTTSFDALVEALDNPAVVNILRARGYTSLTMQIGRGTYRPRRVRTRPGFRVDIFDFRPSLDEAMRAASLVVSHAGAGSVFEALDARAPLLVVVNESLMGNHQVELAEELRRRGHLRWCVPADVEAALEAFDEAELEPYQPGDPREDRIRHRPRHLRRATAMTTELPTAPRRARVDALSRRIAIANVASPHET